MAETRPGKLRIIVNHSFPKSAKQLHLSPTQLSPMNQEIPDTQCNSIPLNPSETSINAVIDSKKFQCAWGTFLECYLLVAKAPEGTEVAIFDVESAFRNVPTYPLVRPFTAVRLEDKIHLDPCLNFRASPAPGIWGCIADAMVKILINEGVEALLKWVDDFIFFRYPKNKLENRKYTYNYDESIIWKTAEMLGWPWAPSKFLPFVYTFVYIGFLWNMTKKEVSLPKAKKEKYWKKLEWWERGMKISLEDMESIIGTLNHICLVVPHGWTRMPMLYRFRSSFKTKETYIKHTVLHSLQEDMAWWKETLVQDFVGVKIKTPTKPLNTIPMVDASMSWGIGLILDDCWLAWELLPGWKTEG